MHFNFAVLLLGVLLGGCGGGGCPSPSPDFGNIEYSRCDTAKTCQYGQTVCICSNRYRGNGLSWYCVPPTCLADTCVPGQRCDYGFEDYTVCDPSGHWITCNGAGCRVGCNTYDRCVQSCAHTDQACPSTCTSQATSKAVLLFNQALSCGQGWCLGINDMGTGHCALDTSMTVLIDPAGAPPGTCDNCLNDALAQLAGKSCINVSSSDCNPSSCVPSYEACFNDQP